MPTISTIAQTFRLPLKFLLVTAVAVQPVLAQDAMKSTILQNTADEQDVKQHTAVLVAQVQALMDELSANSITGDDFKVLQTTKTILNNLSSTQMENVIVSLQKAGATSDAREGVANAVDAYGQQKGIILVFRQILKDYEQRQAAVELPNRFKELTDRQTQNMWTTAKVASDSAGKSATELTTLQQTTQQIVQTDQDALRNDVAMAKQQLDKAVDGSTGDEGAAMKQAQTDFNSGKLQTALDQAASNFKAGHLLQATADQKAARDALRQIAKDLSPSTNTVDALAANAAALQKIIEEQKGLLDQTNSGVDVEPAPTGLDLKQGMLVDETNSLQEDMQTFSAPAAAVVKDAINPMQISRFNLSVHGSFAKAAPSEQDAIDKLEQAEKQMLQQVADAQKAADDANKDSLAKLQDLQKQIQSAQQQQMQVTQQTAQAASAPQPNPSATAQDQQNQIQKETSDMQATAQPLSLPAAQALADAETAMSKAQPDMTDPSKAADVNADQQAAQTALAQANQAISDQIASTQAAAADPAALAAAASALSNAQSDVSQAVADSSPQASSTPPARTPAGSSPAAGTPPTAASTPPAGSPTAASTPPASAPAAGAAPAAAPSMANAAKALAAAAQATAAAAATPGLPAAAAANVQAAKASIAAGQQAAAKGNAPATAAAAQAAQTSLAAAQASVAVAQAGMPDAGAPMAGGPPGSPKPGTPVTTPTPPGPDMPSMDGAKVVGGGSTDKGTLHKVSGTGKFVSVAARDRIAIDQTQEEKRPQEYAPMIDQYMKNLADQSSSTSP